MRAVLICHFTARLFLFEEIKLLNYLSKGIDEKDLFKKIKMGKFEVPSHVTIGARLLIERILKLEPCERLTAEQVLNIYFIPFILQILEDQWLQSYRVQRFISQ
jgi:hypothetical protein